MVHLMTASTKYSERKQEILWSHIDKRGPDECWPWLMSDNGYGYGRMSTLDNKTVLAHRAVYELTVGEIPDGLTLDHTCHDPEVCKGLGSDCPHRRCCNPAHLEPVPSGVNTRRGGAGARDREKTHCPRGHEYNEENTVRRMNGGYMKRHCRECRRRRYHTTGR